MTNITLPQLRSVATRGADSPHIFTAAQWLREALAAVPESKTWTTRELLQSLGPLDKAAAKVIQQALWRLRSEHMVDDCFATDNTRRFMGNPLILWKRSGH